MINKNLNLVKNNFNELPNNIEAEQAVIGSILLNNEIFDDINTIISSNNLYDPMHQKIFSAIENAYQNSTEIMKEKMEELTGGLNLNLPGMNDED